MNLSHKFSADRPIASSIDDKLGRASFANAIALAIAGWKSKDSLVVALYGAWGTGKSSLKALAIEALEKQAIGIDVMEFSPWQFSGGNIQAAFFRDLGTTLGQNAAATDSKDTIAKLEVYAASLHLTSETVRGMHGLIRGILFALIFATGISVSDLVHGNRLLLIVMLGVGIALEWSLGVSQRVMKAIAAVEKARSKANEKTTAELKRAIANSLVARDRPVLVILDDIDRLERREIRTVMTMVKANADFPNLVYLLLFQRELVEWSLKEEGAPPNGGQFLQKIVQVGFDVPAVDRDRLNRVLFAGLDEELVSADLERTFDQDRWNAIFTDGIQEYFATLRDVHRYLGTFAFHMALFRSEGVSEVNPVDLIAIEALRTFEQPLYNALPAAKLILTERAGDVFPPTKEQVHAGMTALLEKATNRKCAETLLAQLFPHVQSIIKKHTFGGGADEDGWFRELRVCSKNVFDRYFQFSIAEKEMSNARMQALLSLVGNREKLASEFQALETEGLLLTAIERLEAFKQEISLEAADSFVPAIMDVGERLSQERQGFFGIAPATHATRIVFWYLITEPDPGRREEILTRAIQSCQGINTAIQVVSLEKPSEKRRREFDQFLLADDQALERVRHVCLVRIRNAAEDGTLQANVNLLSVLYHWGEWAGSDEEPKAWVQGLLQSPSGIIAFLKACTRVMFTNGKRSTYFSVQDLQFFSSKEKFTAALKGLPDKVASTVHSEIERFNSAIAAKANGGQEETL